MTTQVSSYTVDLSPLSTAEVLIKTDDPNAVQILRSLDARLSRRYEGWLILPHKASVFEALYNAGALARFKDGHWMYLFSTGIERPLYKATEYARKIVGVRR